MFRVQGLGVKKKKKEKKKSPTKNRCQNRPFFGGVGSSDLRVAFSTSWMVRTLRGPGFDASPMRESPRTITAPCAPPKTVAENFF